MRIVELLNNITLPITNEEAELLDKFSEGRVLYKSNLDEHEQRIAGSLVNKDVLLLPNVIVLVPVPDVVPE